MATNGLSNMATKPGSKEFLSRLNTADPLIVAEGYLLELNRRGYNSNGSFVPLVVLDHPEKVEELTKEFVHAGSDVCMAFVYSANESTLKNVGVSREDYQLLNRRAHEIAKKVARETGTLFCSGIAATKVYDPDDPEAIARCEQLIREQVEFSAKYEVDFLCIETQRDYGEASLALKICKEYDIPAVVTLQAIAPGDDVSVVQTYDGYSLVEALRKLEEEGAACVGLNCCRGPHTIIPLMKEIRQNVKGPLACMPVAYRTTPSEFSWFYLRHPVTGEKSYPDDLDAHGIGKTDVEWYAKELRDIGVEYVGFCCGNCPSYTRTLAMSYGRQPPAAKYTSDFKEKNLTVSKSVSKTTRNHQQLGQFMGIIG